jgi:CheY-like chemotaxis protein
MQESFMNKIRRSPDPEPGLPGASSPEILVADDNPQILELLEAYLEPLDVRVRAVADGDEALAAVKEQTPALILLDIMMPKRSGFEVCRLLKQDPQYAEIPIIMVTALHEMGDQERAQDSGADGFITKPVNKLVLIELIQKYLQQA